MFKLNNNVVQRVSSQIEHHSARPARKASIVSAVEAASQSAQTVLCWLSVHCPHISDRHTAVACDSEIATHSEAVAVSGTSGSWHTPTSDDTDETPGDCTNEQCEGFGQLVGYV